MLNSKVFSYSIYFFTLLFPLLIINEFFLENFFSTDKNLHPRTKNLIRTFNVIYLVVFYFFYLKREFVIQFLKKHYIEYKKRLIQFFQYLLFFILFALITLEIYYFVLGLWQVSADLTIVYGFDTDSQLMINKTKNGEAYFIPYGVFWSRLIILLKNIFFIYQEPNIYEIEKVLYFSCLLINLFSFVGLSYLLTKKFNKSFIEKLIYFSLIFNIFLYNDFWFSYLFRARVELLFSLLCCLFMFFYFRAYEENKLSIKIFAFILIGAAISTKTTFIIFLPFVFFHQIIVREKFSKIVILFSIVFICYILITFEKIFKIFEIVEFLKWYSYFSTSYDLRSIAFRFDQFFEQSIIIFSLLIFFILINYKNIILNQFKIKNLYAFIIPTLPLIYISKNYNMPTEHYTLPFISIYAILIVSIFKFKKNNIYGNYLFVFFKYLIFISILIFLTNSNLKKFEARKNSDIKRNNDLKTFVSKINNLNIKENILVDGYVPFDVNNEKYIQCWHLSCNFDKISPDNIELLIINSKDSDQLFSQDTSYYHPNLKISEKKKFYKIFKSDQKIISDHLNRDWIQLQIDNKFKVWKKKDN